MSDKETPPWLQPVPEGEESGSLLGGKMTVIIAGAAILLVVLFIAVVVVFGTSDPADDAPRVITASSEPVKTRPEEQGGLQIANQDKEVFEKADGSVSNEVPFLGDQPEQPLENIPETPTETQDQVTTEAQQALNDVINDVTEEAPEKVTDSVQPAQSASELTPKPTVVDTPVPAAVAPQTTTVTNGYKIQLGAYGSRARAESAWPGLKSKFPDLLRTLGPFYEPVVSGDRTLYRLRAGDVATRAEADQVCLALKGKGQACIVVSP
jgi:cell division protein FtsN